MVNTFEQKQNTQGALSGNFGPEILQSQKLIETNFATFFCTEL